MGKDWEALGGGVESVCHQGCGVGRVGSDPPWGEETVVRRLENPGQPGGAVVCADWWGWGMSVGKIGVGAESGEWDESGSIRAITS